MSLARVMIVEDEPLTAMEEQTVLQGLGYDVVAVTHTGEKAVVEAGELLPDIVLMDIKLAGPMDGKEAARLIRERHDILVLFVSAIKDQSILEQGFPCVNKPFSQEELVKSVEQVLAGAG
jgi:CheY-like chemotaxis protein